MTQVELAARLGLRQGYVSGLERGARVPSLEMLARIAEALRVKPWRLLR